MPESGGLHDQLSKDDPNYEIGKRFSLEAWADSHALVAEGLAGRLSFSDFVESCILTFCQAAEAQVAFKDKDDVPVSARCQALDEMAKKFIRKFKQHLRPARQRLGEANVEGAIEELSRRVKEIAALSKQRILEEALARSTTITPAPFSPSPATFVRRSTRTIVMQRFGPDRVTDIKAPKFNYGFSSELPASARPKVHAERLRAEQDLAERKGSIKNFSDAESLLVDLILRVFGVFSKELLELGFQGRGSVEELDSEALKFLKAYAVQAGFMDNLTLGPTTNVETEIPDHIWRTIESAEQWKEYRRKLQLVAEAQAAQGRASSGAASVNQAKQRRRVPDLDMSRERLDLRAHGSDDLHGTEPAPNSKDQETIPEEEDGHLIHQASRTVPEPGSSTRAAEASSLSSDESGAKPPSPVGNGQENYPTATATHPTLELLGKILAKMTTTLEKWAAEHRIGRTSVFDWKAALNAGRVPKGRVSQEKCVEIEEAIEEDAKALGLTTRTSSD
jgi:hypothetical protein